jgi:hypothetical protein
LSSPKALPAFRSGPIPEISAGGLTVKEHLSLRKHLILILFSLTISAITFGQAAQTKNTTASPGVPRLVKFNGLLKDASGKLLTNTVGIAFAIYSEQSGGVPLWQETQNVQLSQGRYTAFLGQSTSTGIPAELFASGQPRWLGMRALLPGEEEQLRVLLASVPYALKAVDADTLGGLPASAFIQANGGNSSSVVLAPATAAGSSKEGILPPTISPVTTNGGTSGTISEFDSATDIKNSPIVVNSQPVDLTDVVEMSNLKVQRLNNVRYADQFPGSPDPCAQITNAIADLPSTGGIVDARGFQGTLPPCATTVTISKPAQILLGKMTLTGPTTGPIFDIESPQVQISGMSRSNDTLLISQDNSDGIYIGYSKVLWRIEHLTVQDGFGSGRSAGAGINAVGVNGAGTCLGTDQSGFINDFHTYKMWYGVYLTCAVQTTLEWIELDSSGWEGLFVEGGTGLDCLNCWMQFNGGSGIHLRYVAASNIIGGEQNNNGGVGVLIDATAPMGDPICSGCPSTGDLVASDIEANSQGGVDVFDSGSIKILGSINVSQTNWDGVHCEGGSNLIVGAFISNVTGTGSGVDASGSSPLLHHACASVVLESAAFQSVSNQTNDPNHVISTLNGSTAIFARGAQIGTASTCDSTHGGTFTYAPGTGQKDSVSVCAKDGNGIYAWRTIY